MGDKHAMKEESARQTKDLNDIVARVRSDITNLERKKINSLIILDVHARDIVDRFVRDSILDAREFEWESQLRFYWEKKEDGVVQGPQNSQFISNCAQMRQKLRHDLPTLPVPTKLPR